MNPVSNASPVLLTAKPAGGKMLAFGAGGESYGIPVLKVKEIIQCIPITRVPKSQSHIKGIINLRGQIIPVIDFRRRFDLAEAAEAGRSCIIVLQVATAARGVLAMGMVVDAVEEVVTIASADIEPTPDFGAAVDASCLVGVAKMKNRVVLLLDIDKVLGGEAADPMILESNQ